jgi:serine O-acetyltransferase
VIGRRLFIDHATGLVIGETAEVGDDVTLYHDVTLGGTSLDKGKRHPTLEDGVIVGAGAQILGPIRVGAGARIGANAVVLSDVTKGATMVGIPARMIMQREQMGDGEFRAYGTPLGDVPDPVARGFDNLRAQVAELTQRIQELESRIAAHDSVGPSRATGTKGEGS